MKSNIYILFLMLLLGIACNGQQHIAREIKMHDNLIKSNLHIFMDSCWNKGDVRHFEDLSTKDFTRILNGITVASSQREMQAHMRIFFTGFSDLKVELDSTVVKDNSIFTHWTSRGTHTGMFGEIPATGKKVKVSGLSQFHFDNKGKLIQEDVAYNEWHLLQQLGYTLNRPILE